LADNVIPDIIEIAVGDKPDFKKAEYQLLAQEDSRFTTIIIYQIFIGFGVNVLMYSGAMSGVSTEIIESANLDGAGDLQEFWYIILPSVWPTLTTFIIVGVAGFFTNQLDLYSLYGTNANSNVWTLGYYMFRYTAADDTRFELYPYLSAMGIVFTMIAIPVTLAVKQLLERLGPSAE
jgi:ABC-type sugar transport system permease subunit